jgi:hypothetical protein
MGYQDDQQPLGIMFTTYNPFPSLSGQKEDAYFEVTGGSYSFPPKVTQTTSGVFSLAFSGSGLFTGSHLQRAATIELKGAVDGNTGAVDLTLKAEGSVFHLAIPASDTTGAVALSKRIAADIESKNWSDVYDATSPTLKSAGYTRAHLANDMNAAYGHVSSACRIGPGQYNRVGGFLQVLGDRFTDVLAITVRAQTGPPVATFATIDFKRMDGAWVFVAGNPPGVSNGETDPKLFGIPAPSP